MSAMYLLGFLLIGVGVLRLVAESAVLPRLTAR